MKATKVNSSPNGDEARAKVDPFGEGIDGIVTAIAEEVAYLEEHGLPIYVDRGNGVENLQKARSRA